MTIIERLSKELGISEKRIEAAVTLLDEGNTVPFISRYRKEMTGGMDDGQLRDLSERLAYLRNLDERKQEVSSLITASGNMTEEIGKALEAAQTLAEVEDIYRPFRPKRKTRASVARERGLAPFADLIMEQQRRYEPSLYETAKEYIDPEKELPDVESVIAGAGDIIAENISDDASIRGGLRKIVSDDGILSSHKVEENNVYQQYYDYSEPVRKMPSHRILAVHRGVKEGVLKSDITVDRDEALGFIRDKVLKDTRSEAFQILEPVIQDSFDRLIMPSLEREVNSDLFDRAEDEAIDVFQDNLHNLLMQAPLRGKTVLGYDPGYRTGCKLAVVSPTGSVLKTAVIYPTKPHERIEESKRVVIDLIKRYGVDVVAIGNGTASAESEMFIASVLAAMNGKTKYVIVSEAGASVYSASKLGAEEFPDFDVTERSAVSIARRLQDPLAELVKIDPKSIGVGQYQHDMKPAKLDTALNGVVESCVNSVGVDLNTASYSLLSYIAGIKSGVAKKIVAYRDKNGAFRRRSDILNVSGFGEAAYKQAAGFLRVPDSDEVFDNTGIHPESYGVAKELLDRFGYTADNVRNSEIEILGFKVKKTGEEALAKELGCGVPTLQDIVKELQKPGRDSRDDLPLPELKDRIITFDDLQVGDEMSGIVRNVTAFGAFVDIGVHQDGLLHVSEMSDRKFIKNPAEVVSVNMKINVKIKDIDRERKRIGLSMKGVKQ